MQFLTFAFYLKELYNNFISLYEIIVVCYCFRQTWSVHRLIPAGFCCGYTTGRHLVHTHTENPVPVLCTTRYSPSLSLWTKLGFHCTSVSFDFFHMLYFSSSWTILFRLVQNFCSFSQTVKTTKIASKNRCLILSNGFQWWNVLTDYIVHNFFDCRINISDNNWLF